jgi:hypothetical protein
METTINKNSSEELNQSLQSALNKNNVGYELRLIKTDLSATRIAGLHITSDDVGKPTLIRVLSYSDKTWTEATNSDIFVLYTP